MAARFRYTYKRSEFLQGLKGALKPMEVAAHAAVTEAGQLAVKEGNAHIRSRGFTSRKWQGLRSKVEPKQPSLNVSATITHSFGPTGIFEFGGPIRGKPLLWLPIEANLPPAIRSPRDFIRKVGPLASARSVKPILVGKVRDQTVPVFHGVETVNIRKRLDIAAVVEGVTAALTRLFAKHLHNQ